MNRFLVSATSLLLAGVASAQTARDYISIVGSSTVYPFTTTVAEQFGRAGQFKTPKVESTGTGGGLKLFCTGVGVQHPDIANASRRIKQTEIDTCAKNGVKDISEIKIGYDGIVLARSKSTAPLKLTRQRPVSRAREADPGSVEPADTHRQPQHDLEAGEPNAAGHQDRSARSSADFRNPRRVRRAGVGERLLDRLLDQDPEGCR